MKVCNFIETFPQKACKCTLSLVCFIKHLDFKASFRIPVIHFCMSWPQNVVLSIILKRTWLSIVQLSWQKTLHTVMGLKSVKAIISAKLSSSTGRSRCTYFKSQDDHVPVLRYWHVHHAGRLLLNLFTLWLNL